MFAFGRLKVCRVGQVMELATWSTPVFTVDAVKESATIVPRTERAGSTSTNEFANWWYIDDD